MTFSGIYLGVVERAADPEHLGRLKVRVPTAYGIIGSAVGAIPVDELPWALPMGLPAGGSAASGGLSMLPQVGDQVAVQFLDGEPEKPVWQWLMQTEAQAKNLKLHHYADTTESGKTVTGDPDRAIFSRYGHSVEIKADTLTVTTKEGYQLLLESSQSAVGGQVSIQTPKGQRVALNDVRGNIVLQGLDTAVASAQRVILNGATSILANTTSFTVLAGEASITFEDNNVSIGTSSGASIVIDDDGNVAILAASGASVAIENDLIQIAEPVSGTGFVIESGKISVSAPQMVIDTAALSIGTQAGYPVLMLTPDFLAWLVGHTHESSTPGSPTGPPIPVFMETAASTRLQTS